MVETQEQPGPPVRRIVESGDPQFAERRAAVLRVAVEGGKETLIGLDGHRMTGRSSRGEQHGAEGQGRGQKKDETAHGGSPGRSRSGASAPRISGTSPR